MSAAIVEKLGTLVDTGTQLVPLGGFEFSGYNARLQAKYLEWRKQCLETLEQAGPIAFPYKTKVLGDPNGGFFYQASAQLIQNCVKELYEKLKSSPDLATAAPPAAPPATGATEAAAGTRVLRPPPKPATAVAPPPAPAPTPPATPAVTAAGSRVYVIGEENEPLRLQLAQFLTEIGLEEIVVPRIHGQMLALDTFVHEPDVKYAFFVFTSDDLAYAMFELGHFLGKLGQGRVSVLHMSDVAFPKNVPGISVKPIVVKLEEASLAIMRELKSSGYKISL
ncbi:MAG: nucleotide-binding protein [Bacteroidetes bacterium]|jgi:hypothetical protein|nr:nucleotide-binding protein [Bacteroidota bacterium]